MISSVFFHLCFCVDSQNVIYRELNEISIHKNLYKQYVSLMNENEIKNASVCWIIDIKSSPVHAKFQHKCGWIHFHVITSSIAFHLHLTMFYDPSFVKIHLWLKFLVVVVAFCGDYIALLHPSVVFFVKVHIFQRFQECEERELTKNPAREHKKRSIFCNIWWDNTQHYLSA